MGQIEKNREVMVVTRADGGRGRTKRVKGVKYKVTEGYLTLGGECTMQYTDDIEL